MGPGAWTGMTPLKDWGEEFLWINPTFNLFKKGLDKIQSDKAHAILIVPRWRARVFLRRAWGLAVDFLEFPKGTPMFEGHLITEKGQLGALQELRWGFGPQFAVINWIRQFLDGPHVAKTLATPKLSNMMRLILLGNKSHIVDSHWSSATTSAGPFACLRVERGPGSRPAMRVPGPRHRRS